MKTKTATDDNARFLEIAQALAKKLVNANRILVIQSKEKEKRADELIIANRELVFQNIEKGKREEELSLAYCDLKNSEEYLKHYIEGLEVMMFMTSHRIRQPIAHILGISNLLSKTTNTPKELEVLLNYIKESAIALDLFTKELTLFMVDLDQKGKK